MKFGVSRQPWERPGPQPVKVHGARIHVLPNPSGRNANFSYAEMLEAFRALKTDAVSGG